MRARSIVAALVVLVIGACGGSTDSEGTAASAPPASSSSSTATTHAAITTPSTAPATTSTTQPPDVTITSEDGNASLSVPFGSVDDPSTLSIRVLSPEEYPPVLAGAAQNPGVVLYGLEPAGTVFSEPVRITRRIPTENFANVPPNGVPLITLVVTSDDGETFEQLPGAEVIREGDEFLIRGEISHFSTLVSIYELQYAVIDTQQLGTGLATEVGTSIVADLSFYADDGTPLETPREIVPSGWTRDADVSFFAPGEHFSLGVNCGGLGDFKVGLRYDVTLLSGDNAAESAPGLHSTPLLTGSSETTGLRLKLALPLGCLSPETAMTGRSVDGVFGTDHPGGQTYIPNEDFRGGLSGLFGSFKLAPSVVITDPLVGIIGDANGNGTVDAQDRLHPAVPAIADTGGLGFVAPLYGYGDYFIYLLDGSNFEGTSTSPMTVRDGLLDLQDGFRGDGRFETSIGLFSSQGIPFVNSVGPGEGTEDVIGELIVFITPQILMGG